MRSLDGRGSSYRTDLALLDLATLTVHGEQQDQPSSRVFGRWQANVLAGEAVVFPVVHHREDREHVAKGEAENPLRAAQVAGARAAAKLRRYVMANGCVRLATFTYAKEPATWVDGWQDIENFRRRLYRYWGAAAPIAFVPERGTKNGRRHWHATVDRFVPVEVLAELWGHGFVDIRIIRTADGTEVGPRQASMIAAGYLTAYVKKTFVKGHEFGAHRYSVTKGFVPTASKLLFQTRDEAMSAVDEMRDGLIFRSWSSSEMEKWDGPVVDMCWWEVSDDVYDRWRAGGAPSGVPASTVGSHTDRQG